MLDSFGNEFREGFVCEISGAISKWNNGLWLVRSSYPNYVFLERLNKDLRKSKPNKTSSCRWPLCSYASNRQKAYETDVYNREYAKIKILHEWVEPEPKPVSDKIVFTKHGIKKGDKFCSCYYCLNNDKSITIYSRHYDQHIPREVGLVINESDSMTDYFETDRSKIDQNNPYYEQVLRCVVKNRDSKMVAV